MVVQNISVPEDRRTWLQALTAARAGHQVTVVCPAVHGHPPSRERRDGVDILYVRAYEGHGPLGVLLEAGLSTWRTSREVKRLGPPDLLHVCTPPDSLPWLMRWARDRGATTVYDQHDVVPLLAETKALQRRLAGLHRWLERRTVLNSDIVLTAGTEQAQRLTRLYGIDPVVIRTAAADTTRRHTPRSKPRTLGYVGVMGSQDGVEGLINAMAVLRDRGRDLTLRLAGDGPELARLRTLAADCGLANVEFAGWLTEPALEQFLTDVDAVVIPDPVTPFNHTCPMLKVSHALAQGMPVILTPLEENLAITGGAGFVCSGDTPHQMADAIETFLDSSADERGELGIELRRRYDEILHWSNHEVRYLAVLSSGSI